MTGGADSVLLCAPHMCAPPLYDVFCCVSGEGGLGFHCDSCTGALSQGTCCTFLTVLALVKSQNNGTYKCNKIKLKEVENESYFSKKLL